MVPIEFKIRFPRLFVANHTTIIETAIQATTEEVYSKVAVRLICSGFRNGFVQWQTQGLDSGAGWTVQSHEIRPIKKGVCKLTVEISAWVQGASTPKIWTGTPRPWGQTGLTILEDQNVKSLVFNIQEKAFFGAFTGNIKWPGITTVNDLLATELKDPWQEVPLVREKSQAIPDPGLPGTLDSPLAKEWPSYLGSWRQSSNKNLLILDFQVTQKMWRKVTGEEFRKYLTAEKKDLAHKQSIFFKDDLPVFGVTFDDAAGYCKQLTCYCYGESLLGSEWQFRLPTVSEWKSACGPLPQKLNGVCFNLGLPGYRQGWDAGPVSLTQLKTAKIKPINGLHGLIGNLCEWCADDKDPEGTNAMAHLLGASWSGQDIRNGVVMDYYEPKVRRSSRFGFRVVAERKETGRILD